MKKTVLQLLVASMLLSVMMTPLVAFVSVESAAAQVTPLDDEPDDAPGLGSIIGSPDAGPEPDDAGDRGGYAQLGLAIVLLVAVSFIGWRIFRESKRNRERAVSNVSPDSRL